MSPRALVGIVVVLTGSLLFSGELKQLSIRQILGGGATDGRLSQKSAAPPANTRTRAERKRSIHAKSQHINSQELHIVTIVVEAPPTPTQSDLSPGMPYAELTRRFGEPDVIAAWSTAGTLYEKLGYQGGRRYTEVLFREGRLISSYSETY